jgi:hypothetical protein
MKASGIIIASTAAGLLAFGVAPVSAASPPIMQQAQTAHYRVELDIGAVEEMHMQADVAAQHLTGGEVMVSGSMDAPKDAATAKHIEAHIYTLDKNAGVMDGTIAIAVTDAAKKVQQVPIAKMYGIAEGPSDMHFGNNFSLPAGNYAIDVIVNGEKASFTVAVPSA